MTAFTISRTGKLTGTPCHENKTQKDSIQRASSLYAVFFLLFQQRLLTMQRRFVLTMPVRYPQNPHLLHFSLIITPCSYPEQLLKKTYPSNVNTVREIQEINKHDRIYDFKNRKID